ncbi:tryptophan-rich sensory protein [Sulfitobacter sp. S190]|uniref:tryptophan-rich sensory protein n=1 Tax=Sulfitobacter sp. S190 TaxID=2867022 RepID=UPI0021A3AC23|nr:tryptophan-rich sensory protein [Sulfitobacter sp. S190]UWR21330.1 tryptophan-rich sensory protein [Sulfitobacter sp. S190]
MSRPLLAFVCFALAITFAASPAFVPDFGGFDADQFPVPQEDPAVQPAGYAFGIWGLIYLWLVVGLGFGVWKRRDDAAWHAMRGPLAVSLAVGTAWLAVAVASPVWAALLIWIMLISALVALFRSPVDDGWFAALPVGLYAGWLSAASCVSLGLLAAGYGYVSEGTAALGAIFLALVIASAVQTQLRRAPSYGIAVIWALIAVVVQNMGGNSTVAALAAGGAIALLVPTYKAWRA